MIKVSYRSEIDGLRAIAVLAVVGCHAEVPGMQGGYLGVDIFFVISGFLIATIIRSDLEVGTFSLSQFYRRRALRILPALLVMLLATLGMGAVLLSPTELKSLGESALAAISFVSNFYFWSNTGYFGPSANELPLLHTWSLAVEEQFYLLFPLALMASWRFLRSATPMLIAVTAAMSIALAAVIVAPHPEAGFYLLPTRAWELLLGACLSYRTEVTKPIVAETATVLGGATLLFSILLFDSRSPVPGPIALIPCGGAALILLYGDKSSFGQKILASKPLVWIGRISYSLYLWHWPIEVFARQFWQDPRGMGATEVVIYLAAVIVLAAASYYLVEQPFRRTSTGYKSLRIVAATTICITAAAVTFLLTGGLPQRTSAAAREMERFASYDFGTPYLRGSCFLRNEQSWTDFPAKACLERDPHRQTYLLWGDSIAAHLAPGLREVAGKVGIDVRQATRPGCPASVDSKVQYRPTCPSFNAGVWNEIKRSPPDLVILAAQWHVYTSPPFLQSLIDVIEALGARGITVAVIGPPAQYTEKLPLLLARYAALYPRTLDGTKYLSEYPFETDRKMEQVITAIPGTRFISVLKLFCPERRCPVLAPDGVPVQWDTHHLTLEGSILVAEKLLKPLRDFVRPGPRP